MDFINPNENLNSQAAIEAESFLEWKFHVARWAMTCNLVKQTFARPNTNSSEALQRSALCLNLENILEFHSCN